MPVDPVAELADQLIPPDLGGGPAIFCVIDANQPPAGYHLAGNHPQSGYALWQADGALPQLVLTGHEAAPPRLIATGHLVDDVDSILQAAYARADQSVFDGGPVGPLELRRPAVRDAQGIIRFLISRTDAAALLAHLFHPISADKAAS